MPAVIAVNAPGSSRLSRRLLLGAGGGVAVASARAERGPGSAAEDWTEFRRRFMASEGRIVDTGNRNVSHSESQAYGMLAAVRADDQASFSRLLAWTVGNLRRRGDELHSWRFQPEMTPQVTDPNNATDGDLVMAWALVEGGRRWRNAELRRRGVAIARDLLRLCSARIGNRLVLLPGAYGFQSRARSVLNLSYYVFPALRALAMETGEAAWQRLESDGIAILREARFGRWSLPPDWLEVRHEDWHIVPASAWPTRFSFDAVRIPLNLAWGGFAGEPAMQSCLGFWFGPDQRSVPAWTDLRSGQLAPYPAHSGIVAVARLAAAATRRQGDSTAMPRVAGAPDYYAAALVMLSRIAWRDLDLG